MAGPKGVANGFAPLGRVWAEKRPNADLETNEIVEITR